MGTTIVFSLLAAFILFSGFLTVRNELVYRYRRGLLEDIYECSKQDIKTRHGWKWRYEEFDKVAYTEMLYRFWKPLDSFYSNGEFINPKIKKGTLGVRRYGNVS